MRKLEHINSGCVDCVFETMASGEEVRIAEFYGPDSGELATLAAAAPDLLEACDLLERYAREVCKHKSARMTEDALEELLADAIIAAGTAVAKTK